MIVNRNDFAQGSGSTYGVGHQLLSNSSYDPSEIDLAILLLAAKLKRYGNGVVGLDCGANIGVHTVEWAHALDGVGQVIAIEAQERIFYALAGNIAINNCSNAHAIWAAVGAEEGTILVPVPDYSQPASFGSLEIRRTATTENIGQKIDYAADKCASVRLMTIDSLDLARLDLLKIDIEGMEMEALTGAADTIARHRPHVIIEAIKADRQQIAWFLSQRGYQINYHGLNIVALPESEADIDGVVVREVEGITAKP
jgi:FkbM family methyltransferase